LGNYYVRYIDAYIVKSHTDGLDLNATTAVGELFNDLLRTDSDQWDVTIRNGLLNNNNANTNTNTNTSMGTELIVEIQTNMESIILSQLESGSMAQRVQAEYLQELVQRIERILQQDQQQK
jgi:hypothetical protein